MWALFVCCVVFFSTGLVHSPALAGVLRYCDKQESISAAQQDKLLRFAGLIKKELDESNAQVALIARSGLDLSRFDQRYSHAGISLKDSGNAPWSVRQLYYDCETSQPKIFDQGISGFVLGTSDPAIGYVSIVLLPKSRADTLQRAALDNQHSLGLLGKVYSANAYPFEITYQNCNQWVIEMLATAWGSLASERSLAQVWLKDKGYEPSTFNVGNRLLMWLGGAIPWLHSNDHPSSDIEQALYKVSMPASIENFVKDSVPDSTRIELCHTEAHVVIKRGWENIAPGCVPGAGDTVIPLSP